MTKKPETVIEKDLRTKLIEEGKLDHEAIKKFLTLHREIQRCYAFAEAAIPTDIFKPHSSKITEWSDAYGYFVTSCAACHKLAKDEVLYELWDWFSDYFRKTGVDLTESVLFDLDYDQGSYEFLTSYTCAEKFLELPLEYVCKAFHIAEEEAILNAWDDSLDDSLSEFFGLFDHFFHDQFGISIDYTRIRRWYKKNVLKLIGPFERVDKEFGTVTKGTYKNGEYDGPLTQYLRNGDLYQVINYKNGVEHGICELFHDNNVVRVRYNYIDGDIEIGSHLYFDQNGEPLNVKGLYRNGKMHGVHEYYDDEGELQYRKIYKNGKQEGLWIHRSILTPGILSKENMQNGLRNGLSEEFNAHGLLVRAEHFKDGKRHGTCKVFNENTQLISKVNYKEGKLDGLSLIYHPNNQTRKKITYKNGIFVKESEYDDSGKLLPWDPGGIPF